jgi:transposase
MEQTGAYGLRWGQVLEDLGAKVYIADGKDFKNFKLYQAVRKKDDYTDAYYLLSQYLAVIFPTKNYCDLDRKKFLKVLDEIEQELKQTPHALSGLALMELNKLKLVLDWQ